MIAAVSALTDPLAQRLLPAFNLNDQDRRDAWGEYLAAGAYLDLCGYIGRHNHTMVDDDDLVQGTLILAFQKVEAGEYSPGPVPFVAWLVRIAHYKILEAAREHEHASLEDHEELLPDTRNGLPHGERTHLQLVLNGALDDLPARRRNILLMSEIYEYTSEEIASMLNIRADLVRKDKSLALQQLRRQLLSDLLEQDSLAA